MFRIFARRTTVLAAVAACVATALIGDRGFPDDELPTDTRGAAGGGGVAFGLRYAGRVADGDRTPRGDAVELRGARALAVHGRGKTVYVGTELGLLVFARDSATGVLAQSQVLAEGVDLGRGPLAWDARRDRLLADDCGAWRSFAGDGEGGLAEPVELAVEDDPYTCGESLLFDAEGTFAYRVGAGRVDAFAFRPDDTLRYAQTVEAPGLAGAALGSGGRLYAVAEDALLVYERDVSTDALVPVPAARRELAWPAQAVAVASGGAHLLVLDAGGRRVAPFDIADPSRPRALASAALFPDTVDARECRFAEAVPGVPAIDIFCRGVALTAHWVAGALATSTAFVPPADPHSGMPAYGLPHDVAASPDGRHVYVATPMAGVLIFERGGNDAVQAGRSGRTAPGWPSADARDLIHSDGPDLTVDEPVRTRTSFTGTQFKLKVVVRNVGGASAPSTTLTYYRSIDDATITADDEEVHSGEIGAIEPGATATQLSPAMQPESGAYYGACVDAVADETDTANNCSAAVFVAVGTPDLVLASAMVSDQSPDPGATFDISTTVRNDGDDRAPSAYLVYLVSDDPVVDMDDDELGRFEVAPLAAGASFLQTVAITTPSTPGTRHYYGACVVGWEAGLDADIANNCAAAPLVKLSGLLDEIDLAPIGVAYGIAYHNDRLYVVDKDAGEVLAYRLGGRRDADPGFALAEANANSNGMAYVDGRFYLLDSADDHVYAYREDGTRDADHDFELDLSDDADGDNLDASGMVYAAGRFLVVDYADRKVYAYRGDGARDTAGDFALADGAPTEPTGIAYANGRLHVLGDGKAFTYLPGGLREAEFDFDLDEDNSNASGISYGSGRFYVLDRDGKKVYVYLADKVASHFGFDFHFDLGERGQFFGIAYHNERLYVARVSDTVFAYELDGVRGPDFDFSLADGNTSPDGMDLANGRFYVLDKFGYRVYAHRSDGQREAEFDFSIDPNPHAGIADVDGTFYLTDFEADIVYAYTAGGQRDATRDFDLVDGHSEPSGVANVAGTLFVLGGREKAYAYETDGGRIPELDFDLHEGNTVASGMTYGAGNIYVLDNGDDRVYVYSGSLPEGARLSLSARVSDHMPEPGGSFRLHALVRNYGNAASPATTLRYYRSDDPTITTTDEETGTVSVEELAPGGTSEHFVDLTAPAVGTTRYYGFCVDPVATGSYVDPCSAGVAVTVSPLVAQFDLVAENYAPTGLAYHGNKVFVVDSVRDAVYAYGTDGVYDDSAGFELASDNGYPQGIVYAAGRFHVVDYTDEKVYAYREDGARDTAWDFELSDANSHPTGFAHALDRFYVVDRGDDKVYAYREDGSRDGGSDFDLAGANDEPAGFTYSANGFYVADRYDEKAYAYATDGARRDTDLDFDDQNASANGIAYAAGRLYVLDPSDERIYVYMVPDG